MEEMKAILEKYFSQKDEIDTVILFGSFANGKFNSFYEISDEGAFFARGFSSDFGALPKRKIAEICEWNVK